MPAADRAGLEVQERVRLRVAGAASGFLYGLMSALSFPPLGLWGFALLAPLPLVWASWRHRNRPAIVAFWAGLGVLPWWGLAHWWVASISAWGWVPLTLYLAGMTALSMWVASRALGAWPRALFLWPMLWVGIEFFRGVVFMNGYPWYLLAHPLADARVLIWPAAYAGTFAVSALVAVPACAVVAWVAGARTQAGALAAVAAAWPIAGLVLDPWPGSKGMLHVGVVQTDVPQSIKIGWSAEQRYADWQRMRQMIVEVAQQKPDVIVLPEAMQPGMTLDPESLEVERDQDLFWRLMTPEGVEEQLGATALTDELIVLQRALGIPIIIGGEAFDGLKIQKAQGGFQYDAAARYNSVFVIDHGVAPTERYDKVLLTPFGETMPYISWWPWLERHLLSLGARGMMFDLDAGPRLKPVTVTLTDGRKVQLATPVCFEATMPWVCRRLVAGAGVEAFVNLTNDGWFGDWTPGRLHHLLTARWRAIENGVSMVRCANTGVSCAFDQRGRVVAEGVSEAGERVLDRADGVAVYQVPISSGRTVYHRIGDVFGWGCLGLAAGALVMSFTRGRRKSRF